MSLRGAKRRGNLMGVILVFGVFSFVSFSNIFACPAGQSCPAGKDCVADSSQCVADISSSGSGSSTAPTTTKDQLGLTLEPESYFQFGGAGAPIISRAWSFLIESEYVLPESPSEIGLEVDTNIRYQVNPQISVGVSTSALFSSDLANSDIPSETGWVWGLDPGIKF